jgi:hypothetical protein
MGEPGARRRDPRRARIRDSRHRCDDSPLPSASRLPRPDAADVPSEYRTQPRRVDAPQSPSPRPARARIACSSSSCREASEGGGNEPETALRTSRSCASPHALVVRCRSPSTQRSRGYGPQTPRHWLGNRRGAATSPETSGIPGDRVRDQGREPRDRSTPVSWQAS